MVGFGQIKVNGLLCKIWLYCRLFYLFKGELMNRWVVLGATLGLGMMAAQVQAEGLDLLQAAGSAPAAGQLTVTNNRSQAAQVGTFVVAYYDDAACQDRVEKLSTISQNVTFAALSTQHYGINAHVVSEFGPTDRRSVQCVRIQAADPDQPDVGSTAQYSVSCSHGQCVGQDSATMLYQ